MRCVCGERETLEVETLAYSHLNRWKSKTGCGEVASWSPTTKTVADTKIGDTITMTLVPPIEHASGFEDISPWSLPDSTPWTPMSTRLYAKRWRNCGSTDRLSFLKPESSVALGSDSAAASLVCCTWRSSRSAGARVRIGTDHHGAGRAHTALPKTDNSVNRSGQSFRDWPAQTEIAKMKSRDPRHDLTNEEYVGGISAGGRETRPGRRILNTPAPDA